MKNLRILLFALLAIAMLITATAGLAEGYNVDVLEVKIWDNNQLAGLQQIADEWTAQSGVKVNIQVVDWDNYWTLLEAGASGGEMPDMFWMHSNNAQMYMGAQKQLDLTDYIAASDKIDLANYYPGITELYSLNDRNYAIAKDHDTIALLYNKAIFDQYGVAYPDETWTWDDCKAAAEAITEASGGEVYGAACNTSNDQERCSVVEVMVRNAGFLALYVGIAVGAIAVLVPEQELDFERNVVERICNARLAGSIHFMIVVAEGVGGAVDIGKRIEEEIGIHPRVTMLGHIQLGGAPNARDRNTATRMGCFAVRALAECRTNLIIGSRGGDIVETLIEEALVMKKHLQMDRYEVLETMSLGSAMHMT